MLCGLIIFLHPAVSLAFQGTGFSGSRLLRVQVFQGPCPGFGSRVRVQVSEVAKNEAISFPGFCLICVIL